MTQKRFFFLLGWLALLAVPAVGFGQSLADYDYEHLTFRGVGLDYGYIRPTRVESTASYNLRVDLGYLGPRVRIAPTFSYWSSRLRRDELARVADRLNDLGAAFSPEDLGPAEWTQYALGVDGHYVIPVVSYLQAFVGAGAALHVLRGDWPAVEGTLISELLDTVTAGVAALAGAEVAPHPWIRIYAEARYTLASDVRYPGFRLGAALAIPSAMGGNR